MTTRAIAPPKSKKKKAQLPALTFTDLFGIPLKVKKQKKKGGLNPILPHQVDLSIYDKIIVMFSGGKDSLAAFLYLLDRGVDKSRIELWHHCIDGREGSDLMDWACSEDYCRKVAAAFGVPIYFSWKQGGFEGEMTRLNRKTNPIYFEDGEYRLHKTGGILGDESTRMIFPQVSANLAVRWCSSYLKIQVASAAINNQPRFFNAKTLVVTGERGEESANRNQYEVFERSTNDIRDNKKTPRHVDHFRPVLDLKEAEVWQLIENYNIRVHPAYYLGYGRVSCQFCIFGNANQFASGHKISPERAKNLVAYEKSFARFHSGKYANYTLKREGSLLDLIINGTPYKEIDMYPELVRLANSKEYYENIFMNPGEWVLPAGAFSKESCGAK